MLLIFSIQNHAASRQRGIRLQAWQLSPCAQSATDASKVFMDISLDGEKAGRIVMGLYGKQAGHAPAAFFVEWFTGALELEAASW